MRPGFLLAAAAIAGCSPQSLPAGFALRIASVGDLAPLRPNASSTDTAAAVDLVYEPLLRVSEHGELVPAVARNWERLGPDRIRVQLDPALRFSDGSPVHMEDALASARAAGLEARQSGEWLELAAGTGNPLEIAVLYAAVFRRGSPAPLGTGPYALVEADSKHVVLRRVRPQPGRIDRVELQAFPTARDAFARVLRGEANAMLNLDERQGELLEGVPGLRLVRSEDPHSVAVLMNARRLQREDRAALHSSVPVAELARAYGGGCRTPALGRPAGPLPAGRPMAIVADGHHPGLRRVALALRRALGERGGEVRVEPAAAARRLYERGEFDLLANAVLVWPPVTLAWYWRTGSALNGAGYSNLRVDAAFDRGDFAAARAELERDPPVIYVCRRVRLAVVDARIANPRLGPWELLGTLPSWEVAP